MKERNTTNYGTVPCTQLYSVALIEVGTGLLAHKVECDITAECTLFPPSAQKTDALSVLSRPSPSPETLGPKSDRRVLEGHFGAASVGGLRSGPRASGLEGRERGRLPLGLWPATIGRPRRL